MLTESQKRTMVAIVNIFETGTAAGDYSNVTLMKGDKGRLTYGRSQTTIHTGNLYLLIKEYCAAPNAQYADDFAPYLERLKTRALSLDTDSNLKSLLRQAGNDPVMQTVQDEFFDREYFSPALARAKGFGLHLPLSIAVIYDSQVHGHMGKSRTTSLGEVTAVGEQNWIEAYVKTRRAWLASLAHPLPITVYRMDAFQRLIQTGNWELEPPIVVRDITISAEKARPELKVVLLPANSVVDCKPRLEDDRVRVQMRAVCEALNIALPEKKDWAELNPQEDPPGYTRVDLRLLVEGRGWEVMAHHLADQNKIYLRKRG